MNNKYKSFKIYFKERLILKQINFQFHARREEILKFLLKIAMENNLYIVSTQLFPDFKYKIFVEKETVLDDVNSSMVVLSKDKSIVDIRDYYDFCNINKGNLIIKLGMEYDNIIKESNFGCLSESDVDLLWRKIINNYKKTC